MRKFEISLHDHSLIYDLKWCIWPENIHNRSNGHKLFCIDNKET
jgi:hypothetical protein